MGEPFKGWVVRVGDNLFIKRTSRFGPFYGGRPVLTDDRSDALVFTCEKHARAKARVYEYRVKMHGYNLPPKATHEQR
jgi:hypothetical protein